MCEHERLIEIKLDNAKKAKHYHRQAEQCNSDECTTCHFWSGVISTLNELLGKPGEID